MVDVEESYLINGSRDLETKLADQMKPKGSPNAIAISYWTSCPGLVQLMSSEVILLNYNSSYLK